MPQTTVNQNPAVGKEGLLYDAQHAPDALITGYVDESAGIKPGRLVIRSASGDWTGELPDGTGSLGTNVLGISAFTHKGLVNPSSEDNEVYEDNEPLPLLRKGRIWVISEDAFTPSDPVFVRVVAGVGEELGTFRTDADTADAIAFTAARWMTSGDAGGLGVLEVNL